MIAGQGSASREDQLHPAPGLSRLDDVRAIAAGAVRRGLCTVADLAAELAAGPARRTRLLRVALGELTAAGGDLLAVS